MAGFPPGGSAENYALAAFSALRARAAGKPNSQTGLILLKNSLLHLQIVRKQKTLLISSRYPCKYWINFRK
jgi:hypothetical protein